LISAVVFDLGGVLVDWNPRHLYRSLIDDEAEMERFLDEICNQAWNEQQDAGRPFKDAVESLAREHPEHAHLIEAYDREWARMLGEPLAGTVALLDELAHTGVPLYALSNWSAEKFPVAVERYEFLRRFRGIVISGAVGIKKPDPRIYQHLASAYALSPPSTLFIDDSHANVAAARALGFVALRFTSPEVLSDELSSLGLIRRSGT
jgi:2-haloacid dehalogenase